jgi:hypothetical protein
MFCNSTLTTGISMQYDNYIEYFDSYMLSPFGFLELTNNDANIIIPGVFAEYSFEPINNFRVIAGIRGDYAMVNAPTIYSTIHSNIDGQANHTLISPRLHLKYNIIEDIFVMAGSVGKGYRVARELDENSGYLASGRDYWLHNKNTLEEAINYGINLY